ncbi:MAG TPA: AAA family ATPase [Ramlibacter sp.]|nr:AAA family ATPase [Ramlibacter sp.]
MIGRETPLGLLSRALMRAQEGRCQLVLVAGEPGIGKSALIERFLSAQRVPQAIGQCVEQYGVGEPYMPVLEALNGLARGEGGGAVLALLRQAAPTWLVQLPWYLTDADRQQLQREVAGATQQRMLRELGEWLDRHTAGTPLVLVLEDLHWADEATIQLIGYLARRRGASRLLLLGSFRPAEVIASDHPLKALRQELRLHQQCEELDLEAFSEREVAEYLRLRTGGEVAESFVRLLHRHTEGLPLFVVNLAEAMLADNLLRLGPDGWEVRAVSVDDVPRNIAGVIERQIARLSPQLQQWLGAASVAGVEFLDAPVADALEVEVPPLREAFDQLVEQHHWLRHTGWTPLAGGHSAARFAFRHALYRHVFYHSLGAARRVHLHRRLAQALQQAHGRGALEVAGELAMHFECGQDLPAAIGCFQLAAAKALGRCAPNEALQAARNGLRLLAQLPDAGERLATELELRVTEGVSLVQLTVFSGQEVGAVIARAQELCDQLPATRLPARALHGLWWVTFGRGELQRARVLAERMVAQAGSSGDRPLFIAGHSVLGITLTHLGLLPEARAALEQSLQGWTEAGGALASELFVQDPGVESNCYLAVVSHMMGRVTAARRHIAQAEQDAERLQHPPTRAMALNLSAAVHAMLRDYAAVKRKLEAIYQIVDRHWFAGGPRSHGWFYGRAMVALGEVDAGLATMREAAGRNREAGLLAGLTGFHQLYAEACRAAGRLDEAEASVADGLALAAQTGERCLLGPLHRQRGELLLARGDAVAAQEAFEEAVRVTLAGGALQYALDARLAWCRLRHLSVAQRRDALRELLDAYGAEVSPAAVEARALLAALQEQPAAARGV